MQPEIVVQTALNVLRVMIRVVFLVCANFDTFLRFAHVHIDNTVGKAKTLLGRFAATAEQHAKIKKLRNWRRDKAQTHFVLYFDHTEQCKICFIEFVELLVLVP